MPNKESLIRITLLLTALFLFGSGVWLAFDDKVGAAGATYTAAAFVLIFVFLREFKSFKGLGIQAELLDRKLEEADELLSQLRDLAVPIAEMLFSTTVRGGRWSSAMPRKQIYDLILRMEQELRKCGVTEAQLDQAKTDWHLYNQSDLRRPIIAAVHEKLQPHVAQRDKALNSFPGSITPDKRDDYDQLLQARGVALHECEELKALYSLEDGTVVAQAIRTAIQESSVLSDEEKNSLLDSQSEALKDVEHYAKYKEFRRLEVWLNQEETE